MALKKFNPTTPGQRQLVMVDRSALYKGKPVKALTEGKTKSGGRNNKGQVTSRGIGGGHKQRYRLVDFKRRPWDVSATLQRPGRRDVLCWSTAPASYRPAKGSNPPPLHQTRINWVGPGPWGAYNLS